MGNVEAAPLAPHTTGHSALPHPLAFLAVAWTHRALIRRLGWRRIQSGYRGSMLGGTWSVLHPLLLLGVYTFVFSVLFQSRWETDSRGEVALMVFAGLVVYSFFARTVNAAPDLMLAHRTYIKQVVFPVEVLAWVSVMAALFDLLIGLALLFVFHLLTLGAPPAGSLAVVLYVVPLVLLTLGSVWLLSSLGVFLRDISQSVGLFTTALLFLSPIFYPLSRIPEPYATWYTWNPLTVLVEGTRASLFQGSVPDAAALAAVGVLSWGVAWLGFAWFVRTQRSFADVL
jgi:lipopolysaccharide transport system permease protein